MSEILEKLRKNENLTKVLIIFASIILTFLFIILLDKSAYYIGDTLSAMISYLFIFIPGIISGIIYYLIFRRIKESFGIAFLAIISILLIVSILFIIISTGVSSGSLIK